MEAKNGLVHEIDKVLLPQVAMDFVDVLGSADLLETVSNEATLSTLEEAIIFLELEEDLDDITNNSVRPQGENESEEDYQIYLDTVNPGFTYYNNGTVFAPSDAAFQTLFDFMGSEYNSIADFDTEDEIQILRDIIMYHIASGNIMTEDLEAGDEISTLQGDSIEIILTTDSDLILSDSTNTSTAEITNEYIARNGIVYIINEVLLPESAKEFINSL